MIKNWAALQKLLSDFLHTSIYGCQRWVGTRYIPDFGRFSVSSFDAYSQVYLGPIGKPMNMHHLHSSSRVGGLWHARCADTKLFGSVRFINYGSVCPHTP